jgi:hypothetical protein
MEIEMSQMLLPLSNLAYEITVEWKARVRAVTVLHSTTDEEKNDESHKKSLEKNLSVILAWQNVPYMRELLRRLKSILRRKPDLDDESTGIRPLLLDLQGVPRHKQDGIDSSIEMPFFPPHALQPLQLLPENVPPDDQQWVHLEQFLSGVRRLLQLLNLPNIPFLVGSKGDKNTLLDLIEQCNEVWDEAMFCAQYKDWFDMVKRQQELNTGGVLSELSETIREAEIELSIAMASKDQLERVRKRLEALRADKSARYKVLRHIVFDLGYRELNDVIVVQEPEEDATVTFPKLSELGVFGHQLKLSGEVLPVG